MSQRVNILHNCFHCLYISIFARWPRGPPLCIWRPGACLFQPLFLQVLQHQANEIGFGINLCETERFYLFLGSFILNFFVIFQDFSRTFFKIPFFQDFSRPGFWFLKFKDFSRIFQDVRTLFFLSAKTYMCKTMNMRWLRKIFLNSTSNSSP